MSLGLEPKISPGPAGDLPPRAADYDCDDVDGLEAESHGRVYD